MLKNIRNWIRSKFYNGYTMPTVKEISDFLQAKFSLPTRQKNEKITHLSPTQLCELIYSHFNIETQKQRDQLKPIIGTAFKKCGYRVIYMKDSRFSKTFSKKIALIKI